MRLFIASILCFIALTTYVEPLSAEQQVGEEVNWQVIAGGGAINTVQGDLLLSGTLGQPTVGLVTAGDLDIHIGFWQDFTAAGEVLCGDVDASGSVNISDAVYLIGYIFAANPPPDPLSIGDVDCSGTINMSDVVYLIAYIFGGGPEPCAACP